MSALAVLEELYRANPQTDRVRLRGLELDQLDEPTLAFLHAHCFSLKHLNLRDNALTQLPSDFGSFVPTLVSLDVRNNPFPSIPELSEVLATCTSLQSLYVTLHNKTDEKVLRVMLPSLKLLNGNAVGAEEPTRRPLPLSLHLVGSPTSCSSSSRDSHSPSQRWLDTPPSTTASAVRPVRSPQEKRELRIHFAAAKAKSKKTTPTNARATNLSSPRRVQSVKPTELPATISDEKTDWRKLLKQTAAKRDEQRQRGESNATYTEAPDARSLRPPSDTSSTRSIIAELKAIVHGFQKPITTAKGPTNPDDHQLLEQLERQIDQLALQLHNLEKKPLSVDSSQEDGHVVTASLEARWRLVEVGTLYASHRVSSLDKHLGAGIHRLLHTQTQVVEALLRHVNDAICAQQKCVHTSASQQLVVEQQKQQMKLLLDVAETLEKDLEALQHKYEQEKTQREQAQATSESLQSECDGLKQRLTHQQPSNLTPATSQSQRRIRKRHEGTTETKAQPISPRAPNETKSSSPPKPPPLIVRRLTLKQLVDLVHSIVTSKSKYDARMSAIGAPPETLEQHMYTYLNQRFGLPALTIEYAAAIWKGCQLYTRQDNDVAMFHALLRNQVDEDFVGIKKKLQQAVRELLRAYFLAKHPLKSEPVIQQLVDARLHGGMIWEDEWTELLLYLYDPSDSSILMRLVKRKADVYQNQQHSSGGRQHTTTATPTNPVGVPFAVFEKLLYDYQLQGRLKLLEHFRLVFSELDSERVGVLTQPSFRELVMRVAPRKSDDEIHKMLGRVDPFDHDSVTFSDAVRCLLPDVRQISINRRAATTAAVNKCTTRTRK